MAFIQPDIDVITARFESAARTQAARGGRLAWGIFPQDAPGLAAHGDVPFRIASMTKSFTAAAIGLLAANGLDLDLPLARLVPDLVGTSVADRTCRQALTMGTGFTKDDPWADRMEAMSSFDFTAWLQSELTPIAPADTGFEYSNLGYALLGLVAEAVTGRQLTEIITAEVTGPLGMTRTGFDHVDFPDLVPGLRLDRHGRPHPLEPSGPGAFSPIGGMISTVIDIGKWMKVHLDSLAAVDTLAPGSWSRILTDNQQAHRLIGLETSAHHAEAVHYGHGLIHRLDTRFGRVLCHSGGYPGFGSHMRWLPDLGLMLVVLGNTTYYPAERVITGALDAAWATTTGLDLDGHRLERTTTPAPVPYGPVPPEHAQTVLRAASLVAEFDDEAADEIFAVNMDLDEPREERRARFADWREDKQIGQGFTADELTMETPLRGSVRVPGTYLRLGGSTAQPLPPATIAVGLNHLGEVQSITLSD